MGRIAIEELRCKGCGRCIVACPRGVLAISTRRNSGGYLVARVEHHAECVACGLCYYSCPEPDGIAVYRKVSKKKDAGAG